MNSRWSRRHQIVQLDNVYLDKIIRVWQINSGNQRGQGKNLLHRAYTGTVTSGWTSHMRPTCGVQPHVCAPVQALCKRACAGSTVEGDKEFRGLFLVSALDITRSCWVSTNPMNMLFPTQTNPFEYAFTTITY